jgi:hypothetical protein
MSLVSSISSPRVTGDIGSGNKAEDIYFSYSYLCLASWLNFRNIFQLVAEEAFIFPLFYVIISVW